MYGITFFYLFLAVATSAKYHRFHYPRNIECNCVPAHLCADDDIAVNGHGLLDPRNAGGRFCPSASDVCCPKQEPLEVGPDSASAPSSRRSCGISANKIKSRIVSGTTTAFGEHPWNLIILEVGDNSDQNIYKCGASLIHPRVALTAAHCVHPYIESPEKVMVRAGEWDIDKDDEPFSTQDNFVEEILVYFDYDPSSLKSDIAILILGEDFVLQDNVGIICLSSPRERVLENQCLASGWGKDAHNKGKYSSILKKVQVPIVPRDFCQETLRKTRLGPRYLLHKSFICAGGKKNKDACKGDGGSPLICPLLEDKDRFVQIGIVSWGIGCGNEGVPGVYVNVPLYLNWIEGELNERDLDTSYFKI